MNFSIAGKSILLVSVCVAIDIPTTFSDLASVSELSAKWLSVIDESTIRSRLHVSAGCDVLRANAYESVVSTFERVVSFGKFGIERAGGKRPPKSTCDASVE